ncbi:uncharacterized protein BX664DRAFT_339245 [Halteromyces radiatus]|uniref:uncharacterized protein n=1 Tax=Halteromyces radiatus TaxID=101107 RepID=UPI002220A1A5|nr:uncharacterized protein BX664DRAFT_339245 [Halteromyces radiatus]KAI8082860.1 hypothetical protein BX664DRAFT_339245 [Halteromyces radiatus]
MIRVWTNPVYPCNSFFTQSSFISRHKVFIRTIRPICTLPRYSKPSFNKATLLSITRLSLRQHSPTVPYYTLLRHSCLIPTSYSLGALMLTTSTLTPQRELSSIQANTKISRGEDISNSRIKQWMKHILHFLDHWLLEPLLTLRRFVHILLLFTPVLLSSPALVLGNVKNEDTSGSLWWYDFLATQMERAGPSFIKLAQWIASRTDLFPMALCQRLGKLHSNVDPHSFSYTKKVLETTFGQSMDDIFLEFNPDPLGVGAIAQVYKATLRPEIVLNKGNIVKDFIVGDKQTVTLDCISTTDELGRQLNVHTAVAIKVIHPKARQIVRRDLNIMLFFASLLDWLPTMRWLSLPDEVRVFGNMMKDQLDLRIEGQHLERFNQLFADNTEIRFPKPYLHFTSKDVLVEEYENGIPLSVFLHQAAMMKRKHLRQQEDALVVNDIDDDDDGDAQVNHGGVFDHKIANIGLNAFLYMLIVYNFVHADLHPGNIMIKFYKPSAHHPFQIAWSKLWHRELKDDGDLVVNRVLAVQDETELFHELLYELDQEGYVPQLVMLDTGLVNELNDKNRRNFLDLFGAVAKFDGYRVGELMVERCQSPERVIQPDIFALRMQNLILGLKQNTFHLGTVKIGDLLSEVRDMVRAHHVKLEGDFINVVVGIMLLEGIGRQLDPNLDLFKNALPVLRKYSIQDGGKNTIEGMKDVQEHGVMSPHWIKVWIFLELRNWLIRNTRENEWLQLCDILCFNN